MLNKKAIILTFILAIFLAGALASPSLASPSLQSTPTITPTPTTSPQDVVWKVYPLSWPDDYDNTTSPDPLVTVLTDDVGMNDGDGQIPNLYAGIVCEGYNCAKRDIYYRINVIASWDAYHVGDFYYEQARTLQIIIQYAPGASTTLTIPCGSGRSGSCKVDNVTGVIPAADIYQGNGNDYNIRIESRIGGDLINGPTSSVTQEVELSTAPLTCDENYNLLDDLAQGNINPTVELPSPITLTQGNKYRLELSGGPWNTNRYDAAISLDNAASWKVISTNYKDNTDRLDTAECSTRGLNNAYVLYFTAPSDNFRIRVNDLAGQFADNTGSLTYRLTNVDSNSDCKEQFNYNVTDNLLATGSLNVTSITGSFVALDPALGVAGSINSSYASLTPNQWYLLKFTGTYKDYSTGPSLNQFQIQSPIATNGSWENISSYVGTKCAANEGSSISYYFQANGVTSLAARAFSPDGNWANNSGSVTWAIYGVTYVPRPVVCSSRYTLGDARGNIIINASNSAGYELPGFNQTIIPGAVGGEWPGDPGGNTMPPVEDMRYIAIDITGGPWRDNGTPSYLVAITNDGGATWSMLNNSPLAECGYLRDMYHARVFIKVSTLIGAVDTLENGSKKIGLRVYDLDHNFNNNTGSIGVTWYYATNNDIVSDDYNLVANWCYGKFSHAVQPLATLPISAKSTTGAYLVDMPITLDVKLYAIETTGAWQHTSGGPDKYDVQISDDSGETWVRLDKYPGIQCAQYIASDDFHVLAYFTPIQGKRYKVRVNDDLNTFAANPTGTLAVSIYTATASTNAWATCGDNYTLKPVGVSNPSASGNLNALQLALADMATWLESITNTNGLAALGVGYPSIEGNLPQGIGINYTFLNGMVYAIGGYAGGYGSGSDRSNKAIQISLDNGANWQLLESMTQAVCILKTEGGFKRVYFTAPAGANVRLRAVSNNYPDTGGKIDYIVFSSLNNTSSSPIYGTNTPSWAVSCTVACTAPALFTTTSVSGVNLTVPNVDIGAWISYAGCRIEYFFSWCPEHTAALINLITYFKGYEPFGTLYEILSSINAAVKEAESYDLVNSCSPDAPVIEGGGDPTEVIFNQVDNNSPWNGGPAFSPMVVGGFGSPGANEYSIGGDTLNCWSGINNYFGQASLGFLMFIDFTKRAFGGVYNYYINVFFQVAVIGFTLAYIQKRWSPIAW